MSGRIIYEINLGKKMSEYYDVESEYRLPTKEIALDLASLPAGMEVPVLAPLKVDFALRKATLCQRLRIAEASLASAETIKVSKGNLAYVGMIVGTGSAGAVISAIDRNAAEYDVLTLQAALGEVLTAGQVLFEASAADGAAPKNTANFMNYAPVKVEQGATLTIVGRAFSVFEAKLEIPVIAQDKTALTARFMFV
jgi:hypothetical protein